MASLPLEDLISVQMLGGNILNRTFPDTAPPHLYQTLRDAGWNPVAAPAPTTAEQPDAMALANVAQAAEMSVGAFIAARNAGWSPGQPLPNA